ncbi:MAG: hypothetical protein J6T16_00020 [Opitutales bacterium]|nr:hypothetical protein [Opitutales bacterium]
MAEKYYKILSADGFSPTTKFDYRPYLPKDGKPGEWLPKIEERVLHASGYHLTKYWNMWHEKGARIYEAEFRGAVEPDTCAVEEKITCSQIRLLRDATEELLPQLNSPQEAENETWNIGSGNTGVRNLGNFNVGNYNTGSRNTGNRNTGDYNTGDANTGIDNVGNNNRGSSNVGSNNVGHSNAGDGNSGYFNAGSHNKGNSNAGSFNTGSHNVGKWNKASFCVGFFNTREAQIMMFNKPANVRLSQVVLPAYLRKPNPKENFKTAAIDEIKKTLALPNFDYEIFEQITGITKEEIELRIKNEELEK